MTDVYGDLIDVAGFRGDGTVKIRSTVSRPAQDSSALVTAAWHKFDVVAGIVEMTNLDPGPAEVRAQMGQWFESWTVTIPDEPEPITFTTLLDAYVEYDPAIVGQAQSARDAAVSARDAAAGYAQDAEGFASAAQSAYNNLTDDIENAADAIRSQVESDADRAELAASAAESARDITTSARDVTTSARDVTTAARDTAVLARDTAVEAKDDAEEAQGLAESARGTAVSKASEASGYASAASGSAGSAASSAGDASTYKIDAQDARDAAQSARDDAQDARDIAVSKASEASGHASSASGSAGAADSARIAAQAAASSFGLSAGTVTTGSPSSSAQVTVSGSGPAYTLNFTIPRGSQGIQGPQGTGLQLQGRVPSYSNLPSGLNSTTDKGKAWIVDADGLLYIWDGSAFPTSGNGLSIVGARGDNGLSAFQVAQANGFTGTEGEWLASLVGNPGDAGDSAYQIAVDSGFVGTEGEWLDSLHGADGATSWNDLDDKPSTFPPITGLGAADAKPGNWTPSWSQVSGKPSTFTPTIGAGATQAVAGNDPRLTDARTPTAHNHDADDITTGTLDAARIPNLAAGKVTSGVFDAARIPPITSAMITDGTITNADVSASAGIVATKLASGVQTSLGKADTAVQPGAAGSVIVGSLPGSGVTGVLYVVP